MKLLKAIPDGRIPVINITDLFFHRIYRISRDSLRELGIFHRALYPGISHINNRDQ